MTKWVVIALILASTLVPGVQAEKPEPRSADGWNDFSRNYLREYWKAQPFRASAAGLHEFDGNAPDRSQQAIDAWIRFNREAAGKMDQFDVQSLSPDERIDREIIRCAIGTELLEFDDLRAHQRNPMSYDVSWGLSDLIRRNFAPLETRMQAATRLLQATPEVFRIGRSNLVDDLPRVFCRVAAANLGGSVDFIRGDLVEAFATVSDEALQARFRLAASEAASAIDAFVKHLLNETPPRADASFALGSDMYAKMLRNTEGLDIPLDRLVSLGQADLDRNLDRARKICHEHFDGRSVAEVMDDIKKESYSNDELIPSIAAELEEIRQFLVDRNIISIPSPVKPIVAETPKFARWASAMMSTPGPFETVATEAYYDVTPVDPNWSADEQRQWLADFNRFVATNVSVHEAYPGHYVQFLHTNRSRSDVQKSLTSYAAVEGWAHYTEQMMIEEGFHADDPRYELAQLQDALLRNCRYLCSIRMHTQGMSVEQATRFFMENAFLEELASRREAERGTFDPAYLKYTLGKLQILKLRDDYRRKMGTEFSLKAFHDGLLSHGMPPIAVTRERMLGPNPGPSL